MKSWMRIGLLILMASSFAGVASATEPYPERDETQIDHIAQKFGRGWVNIFTCWVEIPHSVAIEWTRTDPITGVFVGVPKGFVWGFTRFSSGLYDVFTFPLPMTTDYGPVLEPEFIITDTWGATIPGFNDFTSNDPHYSESIPTYPQQFRF